MTRRNWKVKVMVPNDWVGRYVVFVKSVSPWYLQFGYLISTGSTILDGYIGVPSYLCFVIRCYQWGIIHIYLHTYMHTVVFFHKC